MFDPKYLLHLSQSGSNDEEEEEEKELVQPGCDFPPRSPGGGHFSTEGEIMRIYQKLCLKGDAVEDQTKWIACCGKMA